MRLFAALPLKPGTSSRHRRSSSCARAPSWIGADPTSSLPLSLPSFGCGDYCRRGGSYIAKRQALACADRSRSDPVLTAFLDQIDAARVSFPSDWTLGAGFLVQGMRRFGCSWLSNASFWEGTCTVQPHGTVCMGKEPLVTFQPYSAGINPCVEDGAWFPLKPLSYYCPVACGCHRGDAHCPDTCPVRGEATPTCPEAQRTNELNPSTAPDCPLTLEPL